MTTPDQPWTPETLLPDRDLDVLLDERWNEGHAAGVAEGRRQATEVLTREWGVRQGNLRWPAPFEDEAAARSVAARREDRSVVSRLVGPWEPAEQAKPTCTCPMIDVTNIREGGEGIRTLVQGLDPACPVCVRANAEQP